MNRLLILAVTAVGLFSALVLGAPSARAKTPMLPNLPAAVEPSDLKPYLRGFRGRGPRKFHVSESTRKPVPGAGFRRRQEAELLNGRGARLGKHYAGQPGKGWSGKVVGAVKASANAPAANAISWLLLDVKSREGSGAFTEAKGILRVSTTGGVARAAGCDEAHERTEARVDYTATYYFLK